MRAQIRSQGGKIAGAIILVALLWQLGTEALLDGLSRIDGATLLGALGLGLLSTVFSAWRWCLVARGLGVPLPLGHAVVGYYRALFLNAALPGGVLGDVYRGARHGRDAGDVRRGLQAVVLERAAGQLVLLAVGGAFLFGRPSPVREYLLSSVVLLAVGAAACVGAVAVIPSRGSAVIARSRRAVRTALAEVRLGLLGRRTWPGVLLASFIALTGYLGVFLLAARAAGTMTPVVELAPVMLIVLLAMALPLSIGGWGPREGASAWAFGAAGLGAGQGLTVAVMYGVLTFAASLPGMVVLLAEFFMRKDFPARTRKGCRRRVRSDAAVVEAHPA
ncbi:lysylphosphatidylglycerol synthase transmembrane domain-containing protein [Streptomyces sp. 21So2-11]|uniref:lysylphosphatidylglycerol synthase transmembrane domain-containing protein n=1 Tax=Streptomyces sp. 21So2-11 TaxID=3144408 RepID=UPI00321A3968